MKARFNLFVVSSLIIILALFFSTAMFLIHIRSEAFRRAQIEQEQAIRVFWQLLQAKGSGFRIVDGKLLAGNYTVNGNYELPDKIQEIFGGTATIFMGDTRVSTNVLRADGSRAVGTRLTGPAHDAIFRGNRPYRGEAPILGITYFTAYDPIRDRNGTIIGILYVGIKKSDFLADYHRLVIEVVTGVVMLGILLIAISRGLLRERSLADARAREKGDQLSLITDSVPVSIAYVDTKMRYLFANRRYEELFGVTGKEGLVGRNVQDVVGDTFFLSREENIRKALAGDEVMFTHEIPRSDASPLSLQTAYLPHRGEDGRILGYFIQHYDITELTRAQEALQASEEQYRTLFETTGTAIFVSEEDTIVSLVNHEFTKLSGYSREEVEGVLSWTAFVTPESRERMLVYHRNRRIDQSLAPSVYECDVVRRDGSLRNILAHVSLFAGTSRSIISFLDITRHKELDASIKSQLTFLQTLINTIPSPIFYKGRDGRYIGCNVAFEQYLGRTQDEIVGKGVEELSPPELAAKYREMDEELFVNPGVQVYDTSIVYADGTLHDVIFNKATFSGEDGRVEGLVGVILDVTERKQAEDKLARREAFLANILDSIQDGICILDENLQIIRTNPVIESLFRGETPIVGRTCHEVFQNRRETCDNCPALHTLQTGSPSFRLFSITENKNEQWFEVRTFPLFDPKESCIIGVIEYWHDITQRKRAEEALQESEDRFHRLFSQNDDAIILFRLDNLSIIDANPAAEKLTGYTPVELKTVAPFSLIKQDVFRLIIDSIPDNIEKAFQLDRTTICRKDGSSAIVAIRAKNLRLRDEYIIHCSIRDSAEKVRLEEEIRATQAKLIHTNKMASIGMLASSVAHEINNPNNCISVNAAMMADIWQDAEPLLIWAQ